MRSLPSDLPDPKGRPDRTGWLTALPYAHRGLHGSDVPENSRAAFEAAIAAGHGIELDVQASRDGEAMVFHDSDLGRLTGATGSLAARDAEELCRIPLHGSAETIPTLKEVLALIAGRAPLLIEVKAPGWSPAALSRSVARALDRYRGEAAVMSFNPQVGHWYGVHAPHVTRGLVVTEAGKPQRGRIRRRLALWRTRPDFLAYDIRDLPSRFAAVQRAKGLPVLTWTCRGGPDRVKASLHADQIIYEVPPPG